MGKWLELIETIKEGMNKKARLIGLVEATPFLINLFFHDLLLNIISFLSVLYFALAVKNLFYNNIISEFKIGSLLIVNSNYMFFSLFLSSFLLTDKSDIFGGELFTISFIVYSLSKVRLHLLVRK